MLGGPQSQFEQVKIFYPAATQTTGEETVEAYFNVLSNIYLDSEENQSNLSRDNWHVVMLLQPFVSQLLNLMLILESLCCVDPRRVAHLPNELSDP
jgi:hypothetical protein